MEAGHAVVGVRAMTSEAVIGKYGPDLAVEIDARACGPQTRRYAQPQGKNNQVQAHSLPLLRVDIWTYYTPKTKLASEKMRPPDF
jgi:hypothetical protein